MLFRSCPLKNKIIKKTMRPSRYKMRADAIAKRLKDGDSVLEIGCGYGGMAQEILKQISVSYTVVDNELMLEQVKNILGNAMEYVTAGDIETLCDRKFTIFISHACLSETPFEYRKYILEMLIKNCQKISVMDFEDTMKPTARMLRNGYELLPAITEYYLNRYFMIKKTPEIGGHGYYEFVGERKK